MAFTGTIDPSNVVSASQQTILDDVLADVFQAVVDVLYTIVIVLIDFFTTPEILGAMVVIGLIYGAWRMFKRRRMSL